MKNNIYTIPAHLPFADTLAEWVLTTYGAEPHELAHILIFLPSRRACLSLREAFLRATQGKPLLLPRMQPLGDVPEELLLAAPLAFLPTDNAAPSSAFKYKRLFTLARLISRQREQVSGRKEHMDHALRLAVELAKLLDEMEREHVLLGELAGLVPDTFAEHWQVTVEFLKILSEHWPRIAKEEGIISPENYRSEVLMALSKYWQAFPPATSVIAAGTTGSIPATAALLKVISTLPQGRVVLPGLDMGASDKYFAHVSESHPQWGMQQLLTKLGCPREDVQVIGKEAGNKRTELLSEIMRPAETSDAWQNIKLDEYALTGMKYVECAHVQEEANVIALMLREVLESPGKTAALITHDRSLARRVAALMHRHGVTIDDSAGIPLSQTPTAIFLRLILEVVASDFAPVPLLSLLKHPLAHAGMERIACLEAARSLEIVCLRGLRVEGGLEGLKSLLQARRDVPADVHALVANLERIFAPLTELFANEEQEIALVTLIEKHLQCVEALAGEGLWEGSEADALTSFVSEVQASVPPDIEPATYPAIFETLLVGKVLRPEYGLHPRLKILSPIEARIQSFDLIVLGGLNEGSWPPAIVSDPWFNRPMRKVIGLPAEERHIGLAAHDFFMLAAAPEVYLTRAQKVDGVPTTPARWLVKLDTLLTKFSLLQELEDTRWRGWAQMLDTPDNVTPCKPPEPKPPLAARPREISVTQVETWMRDPYSLYASKVLRLKLLEPLGKEPTGAEFGNAVHKALERFVLAYPSALPPDAYEKLLESARQELQPLFFNAMVEALWWPRFTRIAAFIIEQERIRRPEVRQVLTEVNGTYLLGDFKLIGRADRIEEASDGSLTIVDYKTGTLPAKKDIEEGLSSQLVLLALIAGDGDMPVRGPARCLEYWQLQGGEDAGKIESIKEAKIDAYIEAAKKGLETLIKTYDNPDFPYLSTPVPARARRYNDYNHLARVKEWS